jgi:hypothetical protein
MQKDKDENTLDNRIAQFERDQKVETTEKVASAPKKKSPTKPTPGNPYTQARIKVLEEYPEWRREEIAEMEKTGNINNRHYEDFVHTVTMLGDSLSA